MNGCKQGCVRVYVCVCAHAHLYVYPSSILTKPLKVRVSQRALLLRKSSWSKGDFIHRQNGWNWMCTQTRGQRKDAPSARTPKVKDTEGAPRAHSVELWEQ